MKRILLPLLLLAACHKEKPYTPAPLAPGALVTGEAALGDWTTDAPGVRRKITPADMPAPFATKSAQSSPKEVERPSGAMPKVPAGFKVELFASGLTNPRMIRAAPNGDLFVAESEKNDVVVFKNGEAKPTVFAADLHQPFGIAFYPPADPKYVYIANTDSIVRFPYAGGAVPRADQKEEIYGKVSGGGHLKGGGHWTRDIAFSKDGTKLFLSVGSKSNVSDDAEEDRRARIFELTPDGKSERVYATGIRNAVGIAVHPDTGELWCSVNERDELGDHLVPDYITSVKDGGFYGWPWFYIGPNQDPRHAGKHPELKDKVIVPDVLLQSHSASLGMAFYTGTQFPETYRGAAFAAEHGSWNRERRTGYKVITAPIQNGKATGEYVDFMTGFVTPDGNVWGRPVAVAVGKDGSLYVTDDTGNVIWRVTYLGAT
ncbi:MAG: sorbosone dehydrogenase family protein [Labilithrix sp.]